MVKEKKIALLGRLALLLATIIWGSSFFILKNTLDSAPTFFVLAVRFSIAGVLLGLVFIKKTVAIRGRVLWKGALLGVIVAAAYIVQTFGLKYTTPAKNAFLTASYCLIVPFMGWIFYKKRPSVYSAIAAVLCVIGIGFVSLTEKFNVELGDGLTLISGFLFAFQIIFIAKFSREEDAMQLIMIMLTTVGVICWILCGCFETIPTDLTFAEWLPILYLTIFATVVAQSFQLLGQKYVPSNGAAIILSLEAPLGALFSLIFYKEQLTVRLGIGFALIILAIWISETKLQFITDFIKKRRKCDQNVISEDEKVIDDEKENETKEAKDD